MAEMAESAKATRRAGDLAREERRRHSLGIASGLVAAECVAIPENEDMAAVVIAGVDTAARFRGKDPTEALAFLALAALVRVNQMRGPPGFPASPAAAYLDAAAWLTAKAAEHKIDGLGDEAEALFEAAETIRGFAAQVSA